MTGRSRWREPRVSLLIQLADQPGALEQALQVFSAHGVNLTHIESRPARGDTFDFFVDCEGTRGDVAVERVIETLQDRSVRLLVLDDKQVPWFPRHVSELDLIAHNTLDAGTDLKSDHPGFQDDGYRAQRARVDALARAHKHGQPLPEVRYSVEETATWREVYKTLGELHRRFACDAYRRIVSELERQKVFGADRVPQLGAVSAFLEARTGFRIRPVAGLLGSRDFLAGLAFRVFFATQYLRHHSRPLYTPEPDVCHELLGHAPMFADQAFADFSQEIGLASLGAADDDIERLARCYWYSVEFGLVREQSGLKAYGAGLLSSSGELAYACSDGATSGNGHPPPAFEAWDPLVAAERPFPITDYQPTYFVADSLQDAKTRMQGFCRQLPRPFYARYSPATERIWVDRAVRRR